MRSGLADEVGEAAVAFGDVVECLVDLAEGEGVVFEAGEVNGADAGQGGHVLGFSRGEPEAADDADLGAHHGEQVQAGAFHHAADVHGGAAAAQGGDRLEHGLGGRAGPEGVDEDVDALAAGPFEGPFAQRPGPGGQDVDAVRGDGLDVVEQGGVAAGAEDPGYAEAERDEASAEAEGSADPVDEDGAAGPAPALRSAEKAVPR